MLEKLFSPLSIKGLTLKNRVVMPPMGTRLASFGGTVTPKMIAYYVERARGGTGLIIAHFAPVTPDGRSSNYPLGIWDDRFVPGLRQLADAVHAAGAAIAIQLAHAGGNSNPAFTGEHLIAPSVVAVTGRELPRAMVGADLDRVRMAFVRAARRAVDAGFDIVQLHMAHGYLLNQFLSPLFNQRTDEYGGDVVRRARFPLEVLREVRKAVGDEVPISIRLSADDVLPGSLGLEDACRIARMLQDEGADVIDVSAGIGESFAISAPPMCSPPGTMVPMAAAIKSAVSVPVVVVGKLHDPRLAEQILAEGKADLVAVGRGLIADAEWANKAAAGRFDSIRPCLTCNHPECHGRIFDQLDIGCVVNAAAGREYSRRLAAAAGPKVVLVVGGGPAGLEAARVAAERGHRVVLIEKERMLGGQMGIAAAPPYKGDIDRLINYYRHEIERLGVDVRTGCEATPTMIAEIAPAAVVLATGALPLVPPIPGIEHAISAWAVLDDRVATGRRVAIIGGGDVGCETAEYLAGRGASVTILEMLPNVAREYMSWTRRLLLDRLAEADVEILLQARVTAIGPNRVAYERQEVAGEVEPVDSVVLAIGALPYNPLAGQLAGLGVPISTVGDAARARNFAAAIREGFEVGFTI